MAFKMATAIAGLLVMMPVSAPDADAAAFYRGGAVTVTPAVAVSNCALGLVYQNAFVPGSADLDPDCVMGQGAQGNHVWVLQDSMKRCNLKQNIGVDGIFGSQTRSALVRLQQHLKIAADGAYGPQTRRAMQHVKVGGGCKRTT